jgi:uncharacterized membrane protein YjjP (DUF1212 family)
MSQKKSTINHPFSILPHRPVTVAAAVLCFFALGIVGSLAGLSPVTCCQRAVLGAGITYLVTGAAVRAINAILTQALIADHISKEFPGDHESEKHP